MSSNSPCYRLAKALTAFKCLSSTSQMACIEALKGTEFFITHASEDEQDCLSQLLSATLNVGVASNLLNAQLKASAIRKGVPNG